ncbi:MAG: hypothetical protein K5655_06375 [Lachnospiraceae bacterium]|nr:hypothetical protein [Lachnospiraceae bacterium]
MGIRFNDYRDNGINKSSDNPGRSQSTSAGSGARASSGAAPGSLESAGTSPTPVPAPVTAKALGDAGLPDTAKNRQIVSSLISQELPIDADTLKSISRTLSAYPNESVDAVILLHSAGVPVNLSSLSDANAFLAARDMLLDALNDINSYIDATDLLSDVLLKDGQDISIDFFTDTPAAASTEFTNEASVQEAPSAFGGVDASAQSSPEFTTVSFGSISDSVDAHMPLSGTNASSQGILGGSTVTSSVDSNIGTDQTNASGTSSPVAGATARNASVNASVSDASSISQAVGSASTVASDVAAGSNNTSPLTETGGSAGADTSGTSAGSNASLLTGSSGFTGADTSGASAGSNASLLTGSSGFTGADTSGTSTGSSASFPTEQGGFAGFRSPNPLDGEPVVASSTVLNTDAGNAFASVSNRLFPAETGDSAGMSASETAAYGQAETSVSGDPGSRNLLSQVPLRDLLNALSAKPGIDRSDISSEGIKRFLESAVSYLESAREISHRREDEAMAAKVDKAMNSMRTLLKLNDMYAYAEVPVKNEDENRKTHLRFFANKKTRIRKDEGTSAVLHLNMPSLKELDIKMVLKGNSLKIDFFSSKEASPLLEADSGTLSEKLRMIGVEPALDFKERIENNPELDPSNLPGSEIVSSPLGIKGFDTRA